MHIVEKNLIVSIIMVAEWMLVLVACKKCIFWMRVPRLGCGNVLITNCFVSSVPFCSCALYMCIFVSSIIFRPFDSILAWNMEYKFFFLFQFPHFLAFFRCAVRFCLHWPNAQNSQETFLWTVNKSSEGNFNGCYEWYEVTR